MIYIIFGASGSGKSTLLTIIREKLGKDSINIKGTTRKKRSYDENEIISYPDGLPYEIYGGENGYIYTQYKYDYGIEKSQLQNAVKNNINHFVICNDIKVITNIKNDFKNNVKVIFLYSDAPRETILSIQKNRNIKDDEIENRLNKIDYLNSLFRQYMSLFDGVIINKFGENPYTSMWNQLQPIISNTYDYNDNNDILQAISNIEKQNDFSNKQKEHTNDKNMIFIIMPMPSINEDLENYYFFNNLYLQLKIIAHELNYSAYNGNNDSSELIDNDIFEKIKKSKVVIADLSLERPNCYLELGYALALNKKILIIAKDKTLIHFDVEHRPRYFYNNPNDREFYLELYNRLAKLINT